jgi:hypothetical protein
VKKTLVAAAKELGRRNWKGVLVATADFKAIAVDVDLSDLAANMKAIYGKPTVTELERQGLL